MAGCQVGGRNGERLLTNRLFVCGDEKRLELDGSQGYTTM